MCSAKNNGDHLLEGEVKHFCLLLCYAMANFLDLFVLILAMCIFFGFRNKTKLIISLHFLMHKLIFHSIKNLTIFTTKIYLLLLSIRPFFIQQTLVDETDNNIPLKYLLSLFIWSYFIIFKKYRNFNWTILQLLVFQAGLMTDINDYMIY